MSNVKTFVLGKNLKPVPVGVVGEMCVSGKCLSRGYLNLQQLNQEKFITVDSINEEMIYRTGDLAFVDNNCNLRLVGREDDQVKIRGYRIELREIEQYIRGFMGVKDVVVGIREDKRILLLIYCAKVILILKYMKSEIIYLQNYLTIWYLHFMLYLTPFLKHYQES